MVKLAHQVSNLLKFRRHPTCFGDLDHVEVSIAFVGRISSHDPRPDGNKVRNGFSKYINHSLARVIYTCDWQQDQVRGPHRVEWER